MIDLVSIWAFIIAFAVFVYVVMDGFDLGLGILFPLFPAKADRDVIMNSVAPVWDGNETWLVLGGGGMMAAFPLAYAVLMPALYTPVIAMLIGLIFRGVAFEFRWRVTSARKPCCAMRDHLRSSTRNRTRPPARFSPQSGAPSRPDRSAGIGRGRSNARYGLYSRHPENRPRLRAYWRRNARRSWIDSTVTAGSKPEPETLIRSQIL